MTIVVLRAMEHLNFRCGFMRKLAITGAFGAVLALSGCNKAPKTNVKDTYFGLNVTIPSCSRGRVVQDPIKFDYGNDAYLLASVKENGSIFGTYVEHADEKLKRLPWPYLDGAVESILKHKCR